MSLGPTLRLASLALLAGAAAMVSAAPAPALPDLRKPEALGPVTVYPDHEKPERFYYAPGELAIVADPSGRPDLHFLQLRYVGTALYGDEGRSGSFSTLTFRVRMRGPSPQQLQVARRFISKRVARSRIELRPLPISRFDAVLVYAPISGGEKQALPEGYFEARDAAADRTSRQAYWSERVYTVPLDARSSQLLWKTLHEGQVSMSIGYAFGSRGLVGELPPETRLRVNDPELARLLRERLGIEDPAQPESAAAADEEELPVGDRLVHSGVASVRVDAQRWPGLFERVDFNEQAPPGYATVKVYCYDFKDGLRPDLFFKKVELEAQAVGGRRVPLSTKFLYSQPDLYARTIRFPVAVYVDRPFRYRVITGGRDGSMREGEWHEQSTWGRILDVTTRPDAPGEQATEVDG